MTRQEIVRELREEYRIRHDRAEAAAQARTLHMLEAHPEIRACQAELDRLYMRWARQALTPGAEGETAQDRAEAARALRAKKAQLMARAGIDERAIAPQYECAACRDTGWVGGPVREECACFTQKLLERLYTQAGMGERSAQTFERFDEDIFPQEKVDALGMGQRAYMRRVRGICERYAADFPAGGKPNLLFFGKTGLGKTYLLNCIAARVLDGGHTVLRMTAFRLFDHMRRYHMGDREGADLTPLMDVEMLIIDDLGSEPMMENISIEYLFSILNERLAARRATLIATNLTPAEIRARYAERVSSRILNAETTEVLQFEGKDLRVLKRPQGNGDRRGEGFPGK